MEEETKLFLSATTKRDIAAVLKRPLKDITMLAYSGIEKYKAFSIPKKKENEFRTIVAPIGYLKAVQRQLLVFFEDIYAPPLCVHGFVRDKSIATNAKCHVKKKAILSLDIEDFFPSIKACRIHGLFRSKPFEFSNEVANLLTELVCFEGALPQGAPTSPVLSNMICFQMDKQLLDYARQEGVIYTRYADDMYFSSTSVWRAKSLYEINECGAIVPNSMISDCILNNGFRVNESKTHVATRSSRQLVAGVVANRKCNFLRAEYRELRVLFHNWEKWGLDYAAGEYMEHRPFYARRLVDETGNLCEKKFVAHVRGRLQYCQMIDDRNDFPSKPLLKLWLMFHDVTHEAIKVSAPERATLQLIVSYDRKRRNEGTGEVEEDAFAASGTAFLADDGYFYSCAHCLRDPGGEFEYPEDAACEVLGKSRLIDLRVSLFQLNMEHDIARRQARGMEKRQPSVRIDTSYLPQIGEKVTAFGFADGKDVLRIVAAEVAEITAGGIVRVDRAFIHGMSGGPVVNTRGNVIGILRTGSIAGDYGYDGEFVLFSKVKEIDSWARVFD